MSFVYGLTLAEGKYYVGRADNINRRINQHINGEGSAWTSLYKFKEVLFIKESTSCFDEEKYTKELMMQYGIDNVRGAGYSTIILDHQTRSKLEHDIRSAKDLCIRCGFEGHFVKDCKKRIDIDGIKIAPKVKKIKKIKVVCDKCHRTGHTTNKCLATTKLDGSPIAEPCQKCGKLGHKQINCLVK